MTHPNAAPGSTACAAVALRAAHRLSGWTLTACLLTAAPAFGHRIEKRFTVNERPVVSIRNMHGQVTVKSWKKLEVLVVADHASEKTEVDTDQTGNRIEVMTHLLAEKVTPTELRANYEITVPEETELQVRTDSGMVIVERVFGDLTFETVAADVQLQEVAGYLLVKTLGGSLVCVRCAGRIEVNSISGNIRLLQPVSSNVRLQTSTGSILFDGEFLRGGMYVMRNHTGPIEVRFSEGDSFDLNANSVYGKVDMDENARLKPPSHSRRATAPRMTHSLLGTFNEGHAKVELSSFNGTIRIRKRE
jgi:DUF4097 and DUF4098 domain-containing protein YvlB